jgi:antitoxin VapB
VALNIKNPVAERLAQELARETGESLTEAVIVSLRERLENRRRRQHSRRLVSDVAELQALVRAQPDRDPRPPEEILGYDAFGLPR